MQIVSHLRQRLSALDNQVPPEQQLSRDAKMSLYIHFLFQFGASMSGVFLNLYLWRLTESLTVNGIYNIINFAVAPFSFALGGWIAKKRDPLVVYRAGIALIALFYLVVMIVQENLVVYYPLFAVFGGLGGGFYWVGYIVLMYDVSTEKNRVRYLSFNSIFFTLAGLLGPAIAGFLIARSEQLAGYLTVFSISFVLLFLAAIFSLRIKAVTSRSKRYFLKLGPLLMHKNNEWLMGLACFFVIGLFQGIMLFLPNILLFRALSREDLIGYLGVLFSAVSISMAFFLPRFLKEERRKFYLLLVAIGYFTGATVMRIEYTLVTVLCFLILNALFSPMQGNIMTSYYFGITSRLPLKGQLRIEAVVFREAFLNTGRVLSILALILLSGDLDTGKLTLLLMAAAATQIIIVGLIGRK
ncbi:MAG: MFS transporter [Gorillibacterium sp.]|nr:MFS transporter [Gorillibacterium sp.]